MASQGIEFVSPVGRLVQGSVSLEAMTDFENDKPKLDDAGNPVKQCFLALAIRKDDPGLGAFYGTLIQAARADYPSLFDANGRCLNPKFAFKMQDGDGVDSNGKSVADKPGFAGCYIFKFATQFLPKAYHEGKFDPTQQIQDAASVIKRGYYIRIAGKVRGNGVAVNDGKKVPGIFLSPELVSLVAFGEEIVGGPDASKVFGAAAPITALPPGATAAPVLGAVAAPPGLSAPPLPGAIAAPLPGIVAPPLPGAVLAPPVGLGPPPSLAPPAPAFQMTASAQGATRESLNALGWTDDALIAAGHMVRM